jgi:hypothetical protein
MSMGLVDDNEWEEELSRLRGETRESKVVDIQRRGRASGDNNVPDSLRKIIGEESVINGRSAALQIAADFGISPASASAYAKGATSTASYDTPSQSILQHINKSRSRAIKRASKTLNSALGSISQEKLDYADAKDLAGIAKDMSVIIKNLEPPKEVTEAGQSSQPQFVIFAPQFRKEETFEVINVSE